MKKMLRTIFTCIKDNIWLIAAVIEHPCMKTRFIRHPCDNSMEFILKATLKAHHKKAPQFIF